MLFKSDAIYSDGTTSATKTITTRLQKLTPENTWDIVIEDTHEKEADAIVYYAQPAIQLISDSIVFYYNQDTKELKISQNCGSTWAVTHTFEGANAVSNRILYADKDNNSAIQCILALVSFNDRIETWKFDIITNSFEKIDEIAPPTTMNIIPQYYYYPDSNG